MRTGILLIFVLVGVCLGKPYEFDRSGAGANISFLFVSDAADFKNLPGIPSCCPAFGSGSGTGGQLNLFYDFKILPDIYAGLSLGYSYLHSNFQSKEETFVMFNEVVTKGEFLHTINVDLESIIFQPFISWNIFDKFRIGIAPYAALMISKWYSQIEQITKPENAGTFIDQNGRDTERRDRNDNSGSFPTPNNFNFGTEFFVSFEAPLNKENTLRINPSFNYGINLGSVVEGLKWSQNNFRIALGFRYDLTPPYNPAMDTIFHDSIILPDTMTAIITELPADSTETTDSTDYGSVVDSSKLLANNNNLFEYDTTKITDIKVITDTLVKVDTIDLNTNNDISLSYSTKDYNGNQLPVGTEIGMLKAETKFPMLFEIFYKNDETNIPPRYLKLNDTRLNYCYFSAYYNLLDKTGKFLKKTKNTRIEIAGSDNIDTAKGLIKAEFVKSYLSEKYGIKSNRLITSGIGGEGGFITFPDPDVVIISCKDSEFYKYFDNTENNLAFELPLIHFKIEKKDNIEIVKWELTVKYQNEIIFRDNSVNGQKLTSTFNTTNLALPVNKNPGYLAYDFILWDSTGKIYKEAGKMRFKIPASGNPIIREYISATALQNLQIPQSKNGLKSIIAVLPPNNNYKQDIDLEKAVKDYLMKYYPGIENRSYTREQIHNESGFPEVDYFDNLVEIRYYR
jgi:hypothetical protein